MAEVPYREYNTITPSMIPAASQQISVGPDVFGAAEGHAVQGLGDEIGRSGATLAATLRQHAALVDENAATDASTDFMVKARGLWDQYGKLNGRDAVQGHDAYQSQLDRLWNETSAKLPNDAARSLFMRGTRGTYIETKSYGSSWADKQGVAWSLDASKGRADAFGAQIASGQNNPEVVSKSLAGGASEIRKMGELTGAPPEAVASDTLAWQGQYLNLLIEGKANAGDVDGAQQMLNAYRSQMDPASVNKTESALSPKLLDAHADAVVQNALGIGQPSTPKGSTAVGPQGFANNIGNLKSSAAPWIGKGSPYNGYETFSTPEQGAAAAARNVVTIAKRNSGQLTISQLAPIWAPASDGNDPEAWAATVSKESGIGPDAQIPLGNVDKMAALLKAVAHVEKGADVALSDDVYRAGAEAAIRGTPLPNAPATSPAPSRDGYGMPDKSSVIARAVSMTQGDPKLQAAVVSRIQQQYALHDAVTETARQDLADQLPAIMRAAAAGDQSVSLEPLLPKMRAALSPADVARYQAEFEALQRIGDLSRGLQWSSPGDLANAEADTRDLTGVIGETIKATAGDDQAMQLFLQSAAAEQIKAMKVDRDKMLSGEHPDPVAYVQGNPAVREAALTLAANPGDPAAVKGYMDAVRGVQTMLGIPPEKQHVLTNAEAAAGALKLTQGDPEAAANAIDKIKAQFGDAALKEVLAQPGVPSYAKLVAFADLPTQAPLRADAIAAMKIKDDDIVKGMKIYGVSSDDLDKAFAEVAKPLLRTTPPGAVAPYLDSAEHLAGYYVMQGMGKDAAAKKAFGIFSQRYAFADTYRVPKQYDASKVADGTRGALQQLQQFNIVPQPGAPVGAGPDYAVNQTIKQLKDGGGRWVTNQDETGLILTYDVTRDGTLGPPVIVDKFPAASPIDIFKKNQAFIKPGVTDFTTKLPADQEQAFRDWVRKNNVPFDPASTEPQDYDMRGFWRALKGQDADPEANKTAVSSIDPNDGRVHYPDRWKTPYHQTFSAESQYATSAAPHWNDRDQLIGAGGVVLFDDRNRYGKLELKFSDLEAGKFGPARPAYNGHWAPSVVPGARQ